jgi:hypothetical protein
VPDVQDARPEAVKAIAPGLKVSGARLENAVEIDVAEERRNDRGWPTSILAARIAGHDFDDRHVGAWAVGGDGVGPIFAIDAVAREWSSWGEVAEPGSRAAEMIERLAGYPETRAARAAAMGRRSQ